jgi:hypothetical protein
MEPTTTECTTGIPVVTREEFIQHLRRISAVVRAWPEWKRSALGWRVVYPEPAPYGDGI